MKSMSLSVQLLRMWLLWEHCRECLVEWHENVEGVALHIKQHRCVADHQQRTCNLSYAIL